MERETVRFVHLRRHRADGAIDNRGGVTVAIADGRFGVAVCSDRDNFCKRVGRVKALGRLEQARTRGFDGAFPPNTPRHIVAWAREEAAKWQEK